MNKRLIALLIVVLILAIGACGFIAYMKISLKHVEFLTPSAVDKLIAMVNKEVKKAQANGCGFPIDTSSLGDLNREEKMLQVASLSNFYFAQFNQSPGRIEDLRKLGQLNPKFQDNVNELVDHCVIYEYANGATVVSCGIRKPASEVVIGKLRSEADTERFYRIDSGEALFIPAPKCVPPTPAK